jgi:hypothetical protein
MTLSRSSLSRRCLVGGTALLLLGGAVFASAPVNAATPSTASDQIISWHTPGTYQWVVPADVTSIDVVAVGGSGGSTCVPGGGGTRVSGTMRVTGGQVLDLTVGGNGVESTVNGVPAVGGSSRTGFEGGAATSASGERGASGGGATLLSRGALSLVAAGGGGAGQCHETKGGNGGSNGDGWTSKYNFLKEAAQGGLRGASGFTQGISSTGRGGGGGGGSSSPTAIGGGGGNGRTVDKVGGGGGGSGDSWIASDASSRAITGTHSDLSRPLIEITYR